ncbi:unnamed protein product [Aphanomyces euteiches]|nr:hypothetical protein AeRB84_020501 [Aphanomyces euteiches]
MKVFLPLFLTSIMTASAVKPTISTLSTGDRAQLMKELAQWHQTYGSIAEAKGLLPITVDSASSTKMDVYLQRFYNNKLAIQQARRNNPKANFSSDHPFALLSEDEFKKYVGRTFENGKQALDALPIQQPEVASVLATSTGVAEMGHCIVTGNLYVLSEQQVTSCSTNGGSQGCDGGYPWYAIDFTTEGLCWESDWPYTSGKTKQTGSRCVSVTVEAGNSVWQNYQGGVVTQCPGAQSDHAVIAVGYDGESGMTASRTRCATRGDRLGAMVATSVWSVGWVASARATSWMRCRPQVESNQANDLPKHSTKLQAIYDERHNSQADIDFTKSDCNYYSSDYGTIWCGN